MKCEHKTGSVMEYHGNVSLSECDYGCGAILVTVTDDNGISHEFTADELLDLARFRCIVFCSCGWAGSTDNAIQAAPDKALCPECESELEASE